MGAVGVRELAERASSVVADVESSGKPTFVTRRGHPVAVVMPVDEDDLLDYVLANAPEYVADMRAADAEIEAGERGRSMDDVFADSDDNTA